MLTCRKLTISRIGYLLAVMLLILAGCSDAPTSEWREIYVSPVVDTQGYATDGKSHFTFGTAVLRVRDYTTWEVKLENNTPFSGLVGYNHLGDGDYYDGKLYLPMGHYGLGQSICVGDAKSTVAVFDAETLQRETVFPVSNARDPSGIAIAPDQGDNGVLYLTPYCDSNHIYTYDLVTLEPLETLTLSSPLQNMQGIAYREGLLYVVSDTPDDRITAVELDGTVRNVIWSVWSYEAEGIDYSQAEIRWLYKTDASTPKVHYLAPRVDP